MNRTISLCFFIITMFIASTNALILKPQHQRLDAENHRVAKIINHRLSELMHLGEGEDLNEPTQDFMSYLMQDTDILLAVLNGKQLSDASVAKIKTYLLDNPQVIDSFLPTNDDSTSKCIQNLNKQQKQKLYGWILDGFDLKNIFVADAPTPDMSEQKLNEITIKALADPELGPIFVKCSIKSPTQ